MNNIVSTYFEDFFLHLSISTLSHLLPHFLHVLQRKFILFSTQKKTSDPSGLFNRGGGLLKEQKERKKFESQLPRVSARYRYIPSC